MVETSAGARSRYESFFIFGSALVAALCGYRGLGLPNHPYQITLGVLTVVLGYHRGWLLLPRRPWEWTLPLLNAASVSALYKILIGSGVRYPFSWAQYPTFSLEKGAEKWIEIPHWAVNWQPSAIALWGLDFTILQTFLLIITLMGALFRFQPFSSLTAILLLAASLPAFASFDWTWVFPALIATGVSLYLQSEVGVSRAKKML